MAVAVGVLGVDWRIAAAVAIALFVLLARALGRRFKRAVGNGDILFWMISQRILPPVVDGDPDLHDVPAASGCSTPTSR